MTKFSLLGIAAVAAYAALAVPVVRAAHATMHPALCRTPTPRPASVPTMNRATPTARTTDYMGWSAWRVRGGWDASDDYNCLPSRMNHGGF